MTCVLVGYLQLLSQLTEVGDYSEAEFVERLEAISSTRSDAYKVMVIEGASS